MRKVQTAAVLALVSLAGCGGSEEDQFQLVRVTGTITKNGKPLADAKVSFVPEQSNKNSTPGVDQTGPEGNYMLTFKGRTGVAPGKYKVMIAPPLELAPGVNAPAEFEKTPRMLLIAKETRNPAHKKAPEAKKEAVKSEFEAEVPDGNGVTLDFDVKASSSAVGIGKK
jgi:hypothetical protein